jgi:hypothetical protein
MTFEQISFLQEQFKINNRIDPGCEVAILAALN